MKNQELQGMRGLAILLVAAFHFSVRWGTHVTHLPSLVPFAEIPSPAFDLLYVARLGVELFFMISGYVITLTLQRSGGFRDFWGRRFARLWPPLVVALPLVTLVLSIAPKLPSSSSSPMALLLSFTLISPDVLSHIWAPAAAIGQTTGVLWTLWIELQFYLLASALYFLFKRNLIVALVAAGIFGQLLGLMQISRFALPIPYGLYSLSFYIWWFIAGAVVFEMRSNGPSLRHWTFFGAAWFASSMCLSNDQVAPLWLSIALNTAFFALFAGFALKRQQSWLASRPMVFIGNLSYEYYLVHEAVGVSILQLLRVSGAPQSQLWGLLPLMVCGLMAWMIYRFWSLLACSWTKLKLTAGSPQ